MMSNLPTLIPISSHLPAISITRIEDLDGKSKEEIWLIICNLITNNVTLGNIINQLNGAIVRKDEEINILRTELSDMATLKNEVAKLLDSNKDLNKRIEDLEKRFAAIEEGLSAHEIGSQADMAAIKRVFPNATKKPFSIRSFANLVKFIKNPSKAADESLCPEGAAEAWDAMDENDKNQIKQNLDELLRQYPDLLYSINILKDNWKVAHTITSVYDSIDHFRSIGDDAMVDAIELCARLLTK